MALIVSFHLRKNKAMIKQQSPLSAAKNFSSRAFFCFDLRWKFCMLKTLIVKRQKMVGLQNFSVPRKAGFIGNQLSLRNEKF